MFNLVMGNLNQSVLWSDGLGRVSVNRTEQRNHTCSRMIWAVHAFLLLRQLPTPLWLIAFCESVRTLWNTANQIKSRLAFSLTEMRMQAVFASSWVVLRSKCNTHFPKRLGVGMYLGCNCTGCVYWSSR